MPRRPYPAYHEERIGDFSGGLNVRDALTELAPNETPDCLNITLDDRGGAVKRFGYVRWNATAGPALYTYAERSHVCGCNFWYSISDGKLYVDSDGILTLAKTFTPGRAISIVDFAGVCYLIHGADGLFQSTDGTTWITVSPTVGPSGGTPAPVPNGDQLAVWQNKLWVADSTSNLLSFCAPGDASKWGSVDDAGSNYIREGNDFPIVCLYGSSGADFGGGGGTSGAASLGIFPTLLIGKRSGAQGSLHRVLDASTADFVTIDQGIGPAGPQSMTSMFGHIYFVSTSGIFSTDGQSALAPVGQKLDKLFLPSVLNYSQAAKFVAGRSGNRVRFSVCTHGQVANDRCIEYHPLFGAFTLRDDAAGCYLETETGDLLGASPTVTGRIYKFDSGGGDDGASIASHLATRFFEAVNGYEARLQHIQVLGHGTVTVSALPDFADSGKDKVITMNRPGSATWDGPSAWDDPTYAWGEATLEDTADFWPRLLGSSFQVVFSETSTAIGIGRGGLPTGAWAVYGVNLSSTWLNPIL